MTAKGDGRRPPLRDRILQAAEARIVAGGVATLRARDVMADAGAALGGLYNAFADLDDVVIHINSRTLASLSERLAAAVAHESDPASALRALARAYLRFAQDNRRLWSALFEYRYGAGRAMPDWHLAEQAELLVQIVEPLRRLRPDWDEEVLSVRARTLFGAIQGIVSTSLADRFVGVSGQGLERELDAFVLMVASGMREAAAAG